MAKHIGRPFVGLTPLRRPFNKRPLQLSVRASRVMRRRVDTKARLKARRPSTISTLWLRRLKQTRLATFPLRPFLASPCRLLSRPFWSPRPLWRLVLAAETLLTLLPARPRQNAFRRLSPVRQPQSLTVAASFRRRLTVAVAPVDIRPCLPAVLSTAVVVESRPVQFSAAQRSVLKSAVPAPSLAPRKATFRRPAVVPSDSGSLRTNSCFFFLLRPNLPRDCDAKKLQLVATREPKIRNELRKP